MPPVGGFFKRRPNQDLHIHTKRITTQDLINTLTEAREYLVNLAFSCTDADSSKSWLALGIEVLGRDVAG